MRESIQDVIVREFTHGWTTEERCEVTKSVYILRIPSSFEANTLAIFQPQATPSTTASQGQMKMKNSLVVLHQTKMRTFYSYQKSKQASFGANNFACA